MSDFPDAPLDPPGDLCPKCHGHLDGFNEREAWDHIEYCDPRGLKAEIRFESEREEGRRT